MDRTRYEFISPTKEDMFDMENLMEVEQLMAEIEKDFHTSDSKLNDVCQRTANAVTNGSKSRSESETLGTYIFPNEHVQVPIMPNNISFESNFNSSQMVAPKTHGPTSHQINIGDADTVRKIIQATVYQTVEQLHRN